MIKCKPTGSLPEVSEGEADRTVCRSGTGGCCENELTIKVRNCGSYYVYYLIRPSGCPISYCFGIVYLHIICLVLSTLLQFSQFIRPEHHWRDLICRNAHLVHQNWYRISFALQLLFFNKS
jgi:hypothetical protein